MAFEYTHDQQNGLDIVDSPSLKLTVRRLGAEMIGLTRKHPQHGDVGLIWRNVELEDPPCFWKSHATVLFPIVGGVHNLKSTTTDGIEVQFNKQHGFIRHSTLELIEAKEQDDHFLLAYRLKNNYETMALYPWQFSLTIIYRLFAKRLEQEMTVENRDEKPMPYQLGWHPGFNTPFLAGEKKDCHLRLPQGWIVKMLNDEHCYLTGQKQTIASKHDFQFTEKELDLTYMFDLSDMPSGKRVVELLDPDETFGVRVHFPDYPHLGIWSDADAPFICIEPWQGMDDSVEQEPFDQKFGMVLLPPGAVDSRRAWIESIG